MRVLSSYRFLTLLSVSVLALSFTHSPRVTADEDEKIKLTWALPERTCLYYETELAPKPADVPDEPKIGKDPAAGIDGDTPAQPRRCESTVVFGYEIDERGVRRPAFPAQDLEQVILQAAGHLPKSAVKVGTTWKATWQHDVTLDRLPPTLGSEYEVIAIEDVKDFGRCARFRGSHVLQNAQTSKARIRWESLQVTTESWFSIAGGCLARCEAVVKGITNQQREAGAVATNDRLQWRMTQRFDSAEKVSLERRSEEALIRGLEYIWSARQKDGGWNRIFRPRGGTALALLALLSCGVRADDPRIIESFRALAALPLDRVYQAAASCMAYEALLIRRRDDMGKPDASLTREEMTELERVTNFLLNGRNKSNNAWGYVIEPDGRWTTLSLIEWSLFGLAAAQRCGVAMPISMVRGLGELVLDWQAEKGAPVKRVVSGEIRSTGTVKVSRLSKAVAARGWTYERKVDSGADPLASIPYASVTCAGINCLASLLEMAQNADKAERHKEFGGVDGFRKWKERVTDAVSSGLAWLELNYSVARNLGEAHSVSSRNHYFVYLHSLERACTFSETEWIGEHKWYDEGRAALLVSQREKGNWVRQIMETTDTVEDTTCAVLFLKRNILKPRWPVFTQKEAE
ncbi:MAG: hypothetical protein IPK87_10955 [Planctomycetes bacterium]|nr:hypothetical protein [Planctomycetota bacterium]